MVPGHSDDLGAVLCDVLHLKRMSFRIVERLAALASPRIAVAADRQALADLLEDERAHVAVLAEAVTRVDAREGAGPHVAALERAVVGRARGAREIDALLTATLACTAVEVSAFSQLAHVDPAFARLHGDEDRHFRLIARLDQALRPGGPAAALARLRLTGALAAVAFTSWWPYRRRQFERLGLDRHRFLRDLFDRLGAAAGALFPRRILHLTASLCLSDAGGRLLGPRPGIRLHERYS
jgi:hypothetical protein